MTLPLPAAPLAAPDAPVCATVTIDLPAERSFHPDRSPPDRRGTHPSIPPVLDALIISDLHLGSDNCQAKPLAQLLESILDGIDSDDAPLRTRRLIINGNVFDSIDFRRLKKTHWKVLSLIRHLSDKIDVTWIAGNHDGSADIVSHLLGVTVKEEIVLHSGGRSLLIIHGHRFDDFIEDHPFLTWCADVAYAVLQKVDRTHYVARLAKRKSKIFVRCLEKIERRSIDYARKLGCQAVICGHTHHAESKTAGDVHYHNAGCWTEHPCTYLTVLAGAVTLRRFAPRHAGVGTD